MSVNDIRIEKLCGPDNWVETHPRFTKLGDIVRAKDIPDYIYKVVSEPVWMPEDLLWNIQMEIIEDE